MNRRTLTAMILGFLVPGAGHFYLGKRDRALVFIVVILFLFVAGLLLDGKLYVPERGKPLSVLASFASLGAGLPYLIARAFGTFGNASSITYEYGTAFTLTAGLMNLLVILDAYDVAENRKP
jgi:hypothetical protein